MRDARHLFAHLAGAAVMLAICVGALVACELPTIWKTTSYRTERCAYVTPYADSLTTSMVTVPLESGDTTLVADSVRLHGCSGPAWEGVVVHP